MNEIKDIDPENIVFSDEMGIDDNEVPLKGWSLQGQRCHAKKSSERKNRYNVIAALNKNLLFAPFVFEGYSSASVYEAYVEHVLVPALRPGMVVIIDNARFHKSKKTTALVEMAGCRIIFLPPYSPDFNPIEHWWSAVKNAIRRLAEGSRDFYKATIQVLSDMYTA